MHSWSMYDLVQRSRISPMDQWVQCHLLGKNRLANLPTRCDLLFHGIVSDTPAVRSVDKKNVLIMQSAGIFSGGPCGAFGAVGNSREGQTCSCGSTSIDYLRTVPGRPQATRLRCAQLDVGEEQPKYWQDITYISVYTCNSGGTRLHTKCT